ncbi:MAG: hypothetical protein SGPRY_007346 [Prymnesium sp.]
MASAISLASRSPELSKLRPQLDRLPSGEGGLLLSFSTAHASLLLSNFLSLTHRALSNAQYKLPLAILTLDTSAHETCEEAAQHLSWNPACLACVEPPFSRHLFGLGDMTSTTDSSIVFGSVEFQRLQKGKVLALRHVLRLVSVNVLLLDLDVALVNNPIPRMLSLASGGELLVVQHGHRGGLYNTGVVLAIPRDETDTLLADWHAVTLAFNSSTPEQHALIHMAAKAKPIRKQIAVVSWREFLHRPRCHSELDKNQKESATRIDHLTRQNLTRMTIGTLIPCASRFNRITKNKVIEPLARSSTRDHDGFGMMGVVVEYVVGLLVIHSLQCVKVARGMDTF